MKHMFIIALLSFLQLFTIYAFCAESKLSDRELIKYITEEPSCMGTVKIIKLEGEKTLFVISNSWIDIQGFRDANMATLNANLTVLCDKLSKKNHDIKKIKYIAQKPGTNDDRVIAETVIKKFPEECN